MTKVIDKLTKVQERQIPKYIDKFIAQAGKPTNRKKTAEAVRNLYENAGYKKPIVIFAESPLAAAIMVAMCRILFKESDLANESSQLGSQLRSQLNSQLGSQLRSQLNSQLGSQLGSQLYSQLRSQLYSQLEAAIQPAKRNKQSMVVSYLVARMGRMVCVWQIYRCAI